MDDLQVPCPACGSLEVVVGQATNPTAARSESGSWAGDPARGHVPLLRDCACQGCRHSFCHDFAFTR